MDNSIENLLKPLTWEERADMEWDGESNPGPDSVHYDTWLAKEEADAEIAYWESVEHHWGTSTSGRD